MENVEKEADDKARKVLIGERIREFFGSEVGEFFLEKLDSDENGLVVDMKNCDPEDITGMKRIHFSMRVIDEIRRYLVEGIEEGNFVRDEIERSSEL